MLTDFSPPELWDSYRALYTRLLLPTQVKEQRAWQSPGCGGAAMR
ncbi:MAG: hypothetical protein ACLS8R_09480 [Anaeromassilibacillus sp.]